MKGAELEYANKGGFNDSKPGQNISAMPQVDIVLNKSCTLPRKAAKISRDNLKQMEISNPIKVEGTQFPDNLIPVSEFEGKNPGLVQVGSVVTDSKTSKVTFDCLPEDETGLGPRAKSVRNKKVVMREPIAKFGSMRVSRPKSLPPARPSDPPPKPPMSDEATGNYYDECAFDSSLESPGEAIYSSIPNTPEKSNSNDFLSPKHDEPLYCNIPMSDSQYEREWELPRKALQESGSVDLLSEIESELATRDFNKKPDEPMDNSIASPSPEKTISSWRDSQSQPKNNPNKNSIPKKYSPKSDATSSVIQAKSKTSLVTQISLDNKDSKVVNDSCSYKKNSGQNLPRSKTISPTSNEQVEGSIPASKTVNPIFNGPSKDTGIDVSSEPDNVIKNSIFLKENNQGKKPAKNIRPSFPPDKNSVIEKKDLIVGKKKDTKPLSAGKNVTSTAKFTKKSDLESDGNKLLNKFASNPDKNAKSIKSAPVKSAKPTVLPAKRPGSVFTKTKPPSVSAGKVKIRSRSNSSSRPTSPKPGQSSPTTPLSPKSKIKNQGQLPSASMSRESSSGKIPTGAKSMGGSNVSSIQKKFEAGFSNPSAGNAGFGNKKTSTDSAKGTNQRTWQM